MRWLLTCLVEPGFAASAPVHTALLSGGGAALVCGAIGVFVVIRGQAFAGHALADIGTAGGAASFLLGIDQLFGFLLAGVIAASGLELLGVQQVRERDLATGIVLGAGLGISALLLYLAVTGSSSGNAAVTVMFGSMFAISPSVANLAVAVGAAALVLMGVLFRPLLLCSIDPDLARMRGVPVRLVGAMHLAMVAVASSLAALTVGAVLSTALLVGPAAVAVRLVRQPLAAVLLSALIGLAATWCGILLAYDSYVWTPGHGWPVSFFVVALVFTAWLLASLLPRAR